MNKRSNIKAGLTFGIFMAIFIIVKDLLFAEVLTSATIIKIIITGVITGGLSGLFFGWVTGWFSNSKFVQRTTNIETEPGESILFQTGANHFKGVEAVGGKLYLTNERLVFQSHKLNIQNHRLSILLSDIQAVVRLKALGLMSNGIQIESLSGKPDKFVVEKPEQWLEKLSGTIKSEKLV